MYLFVYSFLLLATMGIYTNLYLVEASQIWSRQKAVGELLYQFHASAYTMAKELENDLGSLPCRVSTYEIAEGSGGVPACNHTLQMLPSTPSTSYNSRHYLPIGTAFGSASTQFPSAVYETTEGSKYLFTFIPKESTGGTAWYGYTVDEIYTQIKKLGAPLISYGKVYDGNCNGDNGHWVMTGVFQNGKQICFPALAVSGAPGAYSVPEGSVGFISIL